MANIKIALGDFYICGSGRNYEARKPSVFRRAPLCGALPSDTGNFRFPTPSRSNPPENLKISNWRFLYLRCLFENIRTELTGLGGRNSPQTPLPPRPRGDDSFFRRNLRLCQFHWRATFCLILSDSNHLKNSSSHDLYSQDKFFGL